VAQFSNHYQGYLGSLTYRRNLLGLTQNEVRGGCFAAGWGPRERMLGHAQLVCSALWMAHPVLQTGVAIVMYRRKLHRTFPVFFAYILSQILTFAILFPINRWAGYELYFYSYWITDGISLAIGFKVIHEIFLDVFRPYHALRDLGTVLFKWAALVMLLVAGVVAAASPAGQQGPLVQAILTVERCIRVIQCGLILFLVLFSRYLGVSPRQRSFGIALGFGFFASVELILVAINASGHASELQVNIINMIAYNLAIVIWLGYAAVKVPSRDTSANLLMSQRWDQSLNDIHGPVSSDSLIPMFEGMVDRALSRTHQESAEFADRKVTSEAITDAASTETLASHFSKS
jgi:hypothetical protein